MLAGIDGPKQQQLDSVTVKVELGADVKNVAVNVKVAKDGQAVVETVSSKDV